MNGPVATSADRRRRSSNGSWRPPRAERNLDSWHRGRSPGGPAGVRPAPWAVRPSQGCVPSCAVFGEAPLRCPDRRHGPARTPAPPVATVVVKDRTTLWHLPRDPEARSASVRRRCWTCGGPVAGPTRPTAPSPEGPRPPEVLRVGAIPAPHERTPVITTTWHDSTACGSRPDGLTCACFPAPDTPLAEAQVARWTTCAGAAPASGREGGGGGLLGALRPHGAPLRRHGEGLQRSAEQVRFARNGPCATTRNRVAFVETTTGSAAASTPSSRSA